MLPPSIPTISAIKAASAILFAGATALATETLALDTGDLNPWAGVGVVTVVALVVGRYIFQIVETQREELKAERTRNNQLTDNLLSREHDLRAMHEYSAKLRLWVISAGVGLEEELPPLPNLLPVTPIINFSQVFEED